MVTIMLFLVIVMSAGALAQFIDPSLTWQTIETPHFRVNFHPGTEGMAQLTAQAAEEAWAYWKEKLGYAPAGKTEVVIVDLQDGPNGFANLVPNNEFVNFTAYSGFAGGFANSEAQSWEDMVTFHEYGHIADLDFVDGLSQTLRNIFGRSVLPGMGEPTLLIEGIPTYGEFKYRGASRANEPRVAMMLRTMMLENDFPTYQEASFYYSRAAWPGVGSISHDVGPWFVRYLEDTYGEDTFANLKKTMVNDPWWAFGSLLKFNGDFNTVYKRVTGKTGEQLWDEFRVWIQEQFSEQIQEIEAAGITTSRQLSTLGHNSGAPRWSPDGQWVYYGHASPGRAVGLRRVHPDGTGDEPFYAGTFNVKFPADDGVMIYVKSDTYQKFYRRNDFYRYDPETQKETRLTWGERPLSYAVTPDGNSLIYARYNWGEQSPSLSRLDLDSGAIEAIQEFPADVTIEAIALSPDGSTLALSIYRRGGYLDLYTLPADGGELTALTQDRASDSQPTWSPDGDYLLFSSDRTGVYNLYAYRTSEGQFFQVTNLLTGAFASSVSPDGTQLAFSGYSAQGYDVHLMPFNPDHWKSVSFPQETIPAWAGFPSSDYEIHPYDPIPSLLPKLWFPVLGESQIGASTFGLDAFFAQSYGVSGGWDWQAEQPFFDFFYGHSGLLPTISVFGGMNAAGYYAGGNVGYPVLVSNGLSQQISAAYQRSDFGKLSETYSASWVLNSGHGFDLFRDQFDLSVSAVLSVVEGQEPVQKVTTSWNENLRLPVEDPHGFNVRFTGGWSDAQQPERGFVIGGARGQFSVRGFERGLQAGKLAVVGGVEYDHLLFPIERGIGLWPIFFDDLSGGVFVDAGMAGDELGLQQLRFSFGAELSLSFNLSYFGGLTLSVGIAQGIGELTPQIYLGF